MNILPALKQHLVAESVSETIKINHTPDEPDTIIVLRDTGGLEPDHNDTTISDREYKTFQVYVRAASYTDAEAVCDTVRDLLVGRIGMAVDTVVFENILIISEFQPIGEDDTGRYEFTANFKSRVLDTEGSGYVPGSGAIPIRTVTVEELQNVTGTPTAGQMLQYNAGTELWEFVDAPTSAAWGNITGTLGNQSDLQAALDGKSGTGHTHTESQITDLNKYTKAEVDAAIAALQEVPDDTDDLSEGSTNLYNKVPTGGTAGQVMRKNSSTDYDANWAEQEYVFFVYSSSGAQAGNRYNNWADLMDAVPSGTEVRIYFEQSETIPDGTYDWGRLNLYGNGINQNIVVTMNDVVITDWAYGGARAGLLIHYTGSGYAYTSSSSTTVIFDQAFLRCTNQSFFLFDGDAFNDLCALSVDSGSVFQGNDGTYVEPVTLDGAALAIAYQGNSAELQDETVKGSGFYGIQVLDAASIYPLPTQDNLTILFDFGQLNVTDRLIAHDNTDSGLTATNTNAAITELKTELDAFDAATEAYVDGRTLPSTGIVGESTSSTFERGTGSTRQFATKHTVSGYGYALLGHAHCRVTSGTMRTKILLYADDAGGLQPGTLLATSIVTTIDNNTLADNDYPFSIANNYFFRDGQKIWETIMCEDDDGLFYIARDAADTTNGRRLNEEADFDNPSNPFDPSGGGIEDGIPVVWVEFGDPYPRIKSLPETASVTADKRMLITVNGTDYYLPLEEV